MNLRKRLLFLESQSLQGLISKEDQDFFDYIASEKNPTSKQIMENILRFNKYYLLEEIIGKSWLPDKQDISGRIDDE